jgi:hypothetical protein
MAFQVVLRSDVFSDLSTAAIGVLEFGKYRRKTGENGAWREAPAVSRAGGEFLHLSQVTEIQGRKLYSFVERRIHRTPGTQPPCKPLASEIGGVGLEFSVFVHKLFTTVGFPFRRWA